MAITISGPTGEQKYLTAGTIDVIKDCEWAVFDGNSVAKKEVPFIELTEYQPVGDQFTNRAFNWSKLIEVQGGDSYKNTYKANATGNVYTFPFFTTEMRSKVNSWAQDTRVTETAGALAGLFGISVESNVKTLIERAASIGSDIGYGSSYGIEYPKMWQGSDSGATYSFDFYLFNTVSQEKIRDNWNLTYLLSYNNSYNRRSLLLQDAPVLYKVKVPGVRSSPVAAMKELKIDMIGQIRNIQGLAGLPNSCNIPEAYHISITMEDLFVESRQLLEGVKNGNIVEVFVG
jgi:hypothetical protein